MVSPAAAEIVLRERDSAASARRCYAGASMSRPMIVIPDDYPAVMGPSAAYRSLTSRATVSYHDNLPVSTDVLLDRIRDAEYVINIRSSVAFTEPVLAACPHLKVLSLWGTGTDHVDLAAATRLGIAVTNTPAVSAIAMAEHALALMLSVARDIPRIDAKTKKGAWPRGFVTQLHGKTLGVIGLGAIGAQTARIARGIGMDVIAWTMNPAGKPLDEMGVRLVDRDALYRESDVVSLHLRQSSETLGFIGKREFELMKSSAIFINTARGPLVDEAALIEALRLKSIRGAGLDVYDSEPLPENHPLSALPNVVMTPHSGGVTSEALEAGLQLAIDNVFEAIAGRVPHRVA